MDALRMAQGNLKTADVVTAILRAGGHGVAARRNVGWPDGRLTRS